MKQRQKGEYVWELRYYESTPEGRQRKSVTIGTRKLFPTESAARRSDIAQAVLLRVNSACNVTVGTESMEAVIGRYMNEEMPSRHSTRSAYISIINRHIRPRWTGKQLGEIKAIEVERWLAALPLAPKTRRHIKEVMHSIFKCAQRWELIKENPMDLVRVKDGTKRLVKPRILTAPEFQRLLLHVVQPYQTMVLIAGFLGFRVSEIVGLQWADFDFNESTVLVQRSIVQGYVGDVKTECSKDHVPLAPEVVSALLSYRAKCHVTEEGWLFANPRTGKPYFQEQIQKTHLKAAAKKAGITGRVGWHTFRHSYRSWLDESGTSVAVQKELMRHASIQTTMNVYGAAMTNTKRQAQNQVAQRLLSGSTT